jgi:LysR family transcriptional regulator, benzoate and cis,cis-muconate-responsive activator of ben and cat genes
MELRQLKYFVAVAEELNFHRAARRLHVSQPALSRQIQRLENDMQVALLLRSAKRIELTSAGKAFRHRAMDILNDIRKAEEFTRLIGNGEVGRLAIGIFGSAIFSVIPEVLLKFRNSYPGVQLQIFPMTKEEQIQALRDRELTIGFNRLVPQQPDIVQERVLIEELVIAIPEGHAAASMQRVDLRDVLGESIVIYPRGIVPSLATRVYEMYWAYNVEPKVVQEVADVSTAMALVAGGFGLCIVPQAASHLRLPGLVYRPLKSIVPPEIELVCLYRRGDDSPILRSFRGVIASITPLRHNGCRL